MLIKGQLLKDRYDKPTEMWRQLPHFKKNLSFLAMTNSHPLIQDADTAVLMALLCGVKSLT